MQPDDRPKLLQFRKELSLNSSVESNVPVIVQFKSDNALGWIGAEEYVITRKVKCHRPSPQRERPLWRSSWVSQKKLFESPASGIIGFLISITTLTRGTPT